MDPTKENELGREPEIETSSTTGKGTAGIHRVQLAGQRWPKVTVVWVLVASGGLLVFAAGLFAIAHPINDHPEMYFYVNDDHGQPQASAFPAQRGYFCDPGFFLSTCADVDTKEFNPQVPARARGSFEVWLASKWPSPGCHAIAIRVESKPYTTSEFAWLAPLDAAAPLALVFGFLGIVSATYRLVPRKAVVMVPVLVLPVLVAVTFFLITWAQHGGGPLTGC